MNNKDSFKGIFVSSIVYSLLVLGVCVWGSYFLHILIYIIPLALVAILYRYAFYQDVVFSKNKYVSSLILGLILCLITAFILFPLVEVTRNYININLINFRAMYGAKGFILRAIGMALIMSVLYVVIYIMVYRLNSNSESLFARIDRRIFKENEDAIIKHLDDYAATSPATAIRKDKNFNDNVLKFLIKKKIVVKTSDGKYYLRKANIKDVEYRTDIKFDIVFIVCICVLYVLLFVLMGQTSKVNGPVDLYVENKGYSYVKPEGYVSTVGEEESSSILFPKDDVTGNSGVIYLSVFDITTPTPISKNSELRNIKNKYSKMANVTDYQSNAFENPDGNYVISNTITFEDHFESADYIYLLNKSGNCERIILVESRYFADDSPVIQDTKDIVNSVDNRLN